MRFLCISDIHGNASALEAVLADEALRDFHQLVVCGDHLFPGTEPLATWKLLLKYRALCVEGLTDRAIRTFHPEALEPKTPEDQLRVDRLEQTVEDLGELIMAHLGKMPESARLPLESGAEMLIIHGSPMDSTISFSPEMSDEELSALVASDPADTIIFGGSHAPFERQLEGVHIVGVGSVGEHVTEGFASATIVDSTPLGFTVHQYDVALTPEAL